MDQFYDEKISHLNDLIKLARIDGNESLHEIHFINSVADRLGISREDLHRIKNESERVTFKPPEDMYQAMMQFHRLMVLMGIDRIVSQEERDFCLKIGRRLNLKKEAINEIIEKVIDTPRHLISVDEIEKIFFRHYKNQ